MKATRTTYDKIADAVCLLILIGVVIWLIVIWNTIPEQVPSHYNAAGEIDDWDHKGVLWMMPILSWITYGILTLISRYPTTWNVPITVTDENREHVFSMMVHFVSTLKMEIIGFINLFSVTSALVIELPLWLGFMPLIGIILTIVYYIVKLHRAK